MAKNRRKRRRKQRGGQAAAPPPQPVRPGRVAPESHPDVVAARPSGPGSEGTVVGTIVEVEREILWLDVGGVRSMLYASELMLGIGERPADRYAIGDRFEAFVFQMDPDPESGAAQFSIRRASPYPDALADLEVGSEVQATVVNTYDLGIELDIGGVRGNIFDTGLPLSVGETTHERYQPGSQITARVHAINVEDRELVVAARQYAPGYVEALQQRADGDVVSGTVTGFQSNGGLWLDVDGLVGAVGPQELDLAGGASAQDRYSVGETIDSLFVWQIDHEDRVLFLSAKRNAPGYVEALQQCAVGDVVSGTVTGFQSNAGLWLDVDNMVGAIFASELSLDDGESPQQRYPVGDTIAARVWMIDRISRMVILSARRSAADLRVEPVAQGATIDAVVQGTTPRDLRMPIRVLTTYSDSSVEIPPHALSLSTGMPPRFEDRQVIRVVVTELDAEGRPTRLSHRQALDGWEAEMRRLSHNTLAPNARPVPPEALSEAELRAGAAAVDLGPITGFVPEEELDRETGRSIATYNETYRVVVESVDYERRIATVSHDRFEGRWRELAADFEVGAEADGELRDADGGTALLDLGSGLLAEMPVEQLPARAEGGGAEQDRTGETITVQIKSIEAETYEIAAEIKNYDLVQMIAADETLVCELKAVFLKGVQPESPRARQNRQDVNRSVVRAMAGMMNRDGGHVIVGVQDTDKKDGEVVGWKAGGWENQNEMVTALSNLVGRVLSTAAGKLFKPRFEMLPDGHEVLDIDCKPATEPIFLSDGQREEFPVRYPAMTKNLTARDQHEYIQGYIQGRFYGRGAAEA